MGKMAENGQNVNIVVYLHDPNHEVVHYHMFLPEIMVLWSYLS